MRFLLPALFIAVACFGAVPVSADTINHVDANANWNNLVTFDSQFNWDVTTNQLVQGSMVTESSGLGPFNLLFFDGNFIVVDWTDALHNLLQIIPSDHAGSPGTLTSFNDVGTYGGYNMELYNSSGGFYFPQNLSATPSAGYIVITNSPVIQTPEPATWAMLLAGLVALAGAYIIGAKYSTTQPGETITPCNLCTKQQTVS